MPTTLESGVAVQLIALLQHEYASDLSEAEAAELTQLLKQGAYLFLQISVAYRRDYARLLKKATSVLPFGWWDRAVQAAISRGLSCTYTPGQRLKLNTQFQPDSSASLDKRAFPGDATYQKKTGESLPLWPLYGHYRRLLGQYLLHSYGVPKVTTLPSILLDVAPIIVRLYNYVVGFDATLTVAQIVEWGLQHVGLWSAFLHAGGRALVYGPPGTYYATILGDPSPAGFHAFLAFFMTYNYPALHQAWDQEAVRPAYLRAFDVPDYAIVPRKDILARFVIWTADGPAPEISAPISVVDRPIPVFLGLNQDNQFSPSNRVRAAQFTRTVSWFCRDLLPKLNPVDTILMVMDYKRTLIVEVSQYTIMRFLETRMTRERAAAWRSGLRVLTPAAFMVAGLATGSAYSYWQMATATTSLLAGIAYINSAVKLGAGLRKVGVAMSVGSVVYDAATEPMKFYYLPTLLAVSLQARAYYNLLAEETHARRMLLDSVYLDRHVDPKRTLEENMMVQLTALLGVNLKIYKG